MVLERQLGYFPRNKFEDKMITGQSIFINDSSREGLARAIPRVTPGHPQIFSNTQQLSLTNHFQDPTTHTSPNHEIDGDKLGQMPPTIYQPEYQVSRPHGVAENMVDLQGYGHKKQGKDQRMSLSNKYHQINTTPKQQAISSTEEMTLPYHGGMKSPFTAFHKFRNGLGHDQNPTYSDSENKTGKRPRSFSAQSTRTEMETLSDTLKRTRQSKNFNHKRLSLQMTQQKIPERLQSV